MTKKKRKHTPTQTDIDGEVDELATTSMNAFKVRDAMFSRYGKRGDVAAMIKVRIVQLAQEGRLIMRRDA